MGKILGIDLGTTNSCMAIMEGGEPVVIPNSEGTRTTPSVVAFAKNGERLVGQAAKRQAVTNPSNTVFSAKRLVGRKFNEVSEESANVPFKVVSGKNGDAWIEVVENGETKSFPPEQISSMVLAKLKADAEAYLGEKILNNVIHSLNTVDAWDMCVEGIRMGRLDRSALEQWMAGEFNLMHVTKNCGSE